MHLYSISQSLHVPVHTVVSEFVVRLHIAHCDYSHNFSIRTAEVTLDYVIRIHVRLHRSNTFIT